MTRDEIWTAAVAFANAHMRDTGLPENLTVGGSLDLSGTGIKKVPPSARSRMVVCGE